MLRYAILTHLAAKPMTGYDLDRTLDQDAGSVWHATASQIYSELRRLHAEELVSATDLPQTGKPDKRLYRITPLGRRQLKAYLLGPVELSPSRDQVHLRLMNLGRLSPKEGTKVLAQCRSALQERLQVVLHHRDLLAANGYTVDSPGNPYAGYALSIHVAISSLENLLEQLDWVQRHLPGCP